MMNENESAWSKSKPGVVWHLAVAASAIASAPWRAWVAAKLWVWFVVPLGAPNIGLVHALGFSIFVAVFVHPKVNKNDGLTERERDMHGVCDAWLRPLFLLAFGAIVHSFM